MAGCRKGCELKTLLTALIGLSCIGAANAQTLVDEPGNFDQKLVPQIIKEVADEFADPIAVQIRKLHVSTTHPDSICGEVNAKNKMGGYVGFKPFRYITERKKIYFVNTGC